MSSRRKKAQGPNWKDVRKAKVKEASIPNFSIPRDLKEWRRCYNESNLKNSSIHTIDVMEPASRCTDAQYIALRSISQTATSPDWLLHNLDQYGLEEARKEAHELLKMPREFQNYINLVSENISVQSLAGEKDKRWLGSWTAVRQFQEKVLWDQAKIDRQDNSDGTMEQDGEEEPENPKGKKAAKLTSYGDDVAVEPLSSWSMQSEGPVYSVDLGGYNS